ncbi:hypothetical protein TRFO_27818 [Tritrichomonas foetus]|uniref:HMG box domain-containing protein n=1 Tax=Tritrichomonas foetus TaxID=1144522 RepID=A0A1J4K535_9EUKA|nr:hypothetical protein TRFO_27818 [Tritrichomonas foetus]|eukprot:OHT04613.1 hypothetical protein TRFO_27818 [Tritrichomonas foetus]
MSHIRKPNLLPYLKYALDKREQVQKDNPTLGKREINKVIGAMWTSETQEVRQYYKQQCQTEMDAISENQKNKIKPAKPKKEMTVKSLEKKAFITANPFFRYANDRKAQVAKENPGFSYRDVVRYIAAQWHNEPQAVRDFYSSFSTANNNISNNDKNNSNSDSNINAVGKNRDTNSTKNTNMNNNSSLNLSSNDHFNSESSHERNENLDNESDFSEPKNNLSSSRYLGNTQTIDLTPKVLTIELNRNSSQEILNEETQFSYSSFSPYTLNFNDKSTSNSLNSTSGILKNLMKRLNK